MMKDATAVFISGKFNVIHPGHIRLFRLGKELAERLHVALDTNGLNQDEIDWRVNALQAIDLVDQIHTFKIDNSFLIEKIKPHVILKGREFRDRKNPEKALVESYGGKLVFGSGINFFSETEFIDKSNLNSGFDEIKLPIEFMRRNNIGKEVIEDFLEKTPNLNVCVLGDLIIDEYINCHPLGMSNEEPTIVVKAVDKKKFVGGAGIVAAHCSALGANTYFISVIGDDKSGAWAKNKISGYGIREDLILDNSRPTTLKQRYRSGSQTLFKLTELSQEIINPNIQDVVYEKFHRLVGQIDLLIFSDFSYGNLPAELVEKIMSLAKEHNVLVAADSQSSSQVGNLSKFSGAFLVTPTEREARVELRDQSSGLVILLDDLRDYLRAKNVLLKLGPDGILIRGVGANQELLPTEQVEPSNIKPIDVSGAGDSILAASALALAGGFDIYTSAMLGSFIAGIQVGRLGNIPIDREGIERYITN
jgi:rfaE bifunctional protein kinase chain/domain